MWRDIMTGMEFNQELMMEFYEHLALDIGREKKRIGGDFAIATVIIKKEAREHVRKILGSDLVIVILNMAMEERRERVLGRHGGDTNTADRMDVSLQVCCTEISYSNNSALRQPDGRTGSWGAEHCRG